MSCLCRVVSDGLISRYRDQKGCVMTKVSMIQKQGGTADRMFRPNV